MRYIVCDLDNTLFDASHVLDATTHDGFKHASWEGREVSLPDDVLVPQVAETVRLFTTMSQIPTRLIILTSRPERLRKATEDQLKRYGILPDCLIMADDYEHHVGADFKLEMINRLNSQHRVYLVLEDIDSIVTTLRAAGYTVFQVQNDVFTGRVRNQK